MSSDMHAAKNELAAIFPQHKEEIITRIYNNVVRNSDKDNYSHVHYVSICIEQLLELPATSNVLRSKGNHEDSRSVATKSYCDKINLFDRAKEHEVSDGQNKIWKHILGLCDSKSSSSGDEQGIENDYHNKPIPNYQKRHDDKLSKSSNSGYHWVFSDQDDEIFTSEEINNIEKLEYKKLSNKSNIHDSPLLGHKRKLIDITSNENISNTIKRNSDTEEYITKNGPPNRKPYSSCILTRNKKGILNNGFKVSEKQDLSTITKGMVGFLEISKKKIKAIINNVDNTYLEKLINEQTELLPIPEVVNSVVEYLLEHEDYHKVGHIQANSSSTSHSTATITSSMDAFKYNQQSIVLLQNSFPKISTNVIKKVFYKIQNYTKSFNELNNALEQIICGEKNVKDTIIKSFLMGKRNKIKIQDLCGILTEEIQQMEESKKDDITEEHDVATAVDHNIKQYDGEGQTIECGCCYNEVTFEDMVQCVEGHLFCITCLQNYSKEAIYGAGKVELFCMTNGCDSTFPMSQLKKALLENMMEKYMERVQNEDLKLANLDNLIKCPGCEFAAEMDDGDKVFRCQNPSCMKESCRYCKEDWKDHFGVPCKEVEKKEATNLRTTYEEKMTQAKVRKCWQCSTIFLKSDGCNKMTCRCGAKMCYICRQEKIDYQHFCQHPRNPGDGCSLCKKCSLWTDPSEDDDRAIAEIKRLAEEERTKLGGHEQISTISIGPSPSSSKKDNCNQATGQPRDNDEYYGSSEDDSDSSGWSRYDSDSSQNHSVHTHGDFDCDELDYCHDNDTSSSDSDDDIYY